MQDQAATLTPEQPEPKHNFKLFRETPESSTVKSIAYSEETQTLRAKFKSGKPHHYDYFGVTPEQAIPGFQAESVGKWFAEFKKLGHEYKRTNYGIENPLDEIHKPI